MSDSVWEDVVKCESIQWEMCASLCLSTAMKAETLEHPEQRFKNTGHIPLCRQKDAANPAFTVTDEATEQMYSKTDLMSVQPHRL